MTAYPAMEGEEYEDSRVYCDTTIRKLYAERLKKQAASQATSQPASSPASGLESK